MRKRIMISILFSSSLFNCATFERMFESKEERICREKLDSVSNNTSSKAEDIYHYYMGSVYGSCSSVKHQSYPAFKNLVSPAINELLKNSSGRKSKLEQEKSSLESSVNDKRKRMDSEEKLVNGKEKDQQISALKDDMERISMEMHKKKQKRKEELKSKQETLKNEADSLNISVNNNCNVKAGTQVLFISKQFITMYGVGTCGEKEFIGRIVLVGPTAEDVPDIDLNLYSKMSMNPSVRTKHLIAAVRVDGQNLYYSGLYERNQEYVFTHQKPKDFNAKLKRISVIEKEILEMDKKIEISAVKESKDLAELEKKAENLQKQIASYSKAKDSFTESKKQYDDLLRKIELEENKIQDFKSKLQ